MIRRLSRKKFDIYSFDFETHNDEESIAKRETSVWLGCIINENSKIEDPDSYIYSIEEFVDRLEQMSSRYRHHKQKRPCKNICLYDYNLSFEWSFILPELYRRGFKFKEIITEEDEYCFNSVSTRSCSSVWQVQLKFGKKSGTVLFRDLAKVFGGGLGKVAKSFGLETQKGSIDYRKNRLHDYVVTDEEREYCFKDCRILVEILMIMNDKQDKTFFKCASMATYATTKMIEKGYKGYKPYKDFREEYPSLDQKEVLFLRDGVEGGITYAPPRWQYVDIQTPVLHIDAHQMHPSQAYFKLFPVGRGTYGVGKPKDMITKINCCRIMISYTGVILHSIIKLIGVDAIDNAIITVWDFEIATMMKCYKNLKIKFLDYYSYNIQRLPWRKFYSENYKKRLVAKKNNDTYNILYYKLLNNSSYGKLLEKPHNDIMINIVNSEGIITSLVEEKPKEQLKSNAKFTYLPVGSSIPAYSRCELIETAFKLDPSGLKVVYFDTDSIFIIYDEEVKRIWESGIINKNDFLGGWAQEEIISRAEFSAPKRYKTINQDTGETTIKMAGINFNIENDIDFESINIDHDKYIIQRAFRCKGGTIVDVQEKVVDVQKKYKQIYEDNQGKTFKGL